MTSLSSSSGGVNINKPNTWEVGHEYDFGNGVYGQRFTGSSLPSGVTVLTTTFNAGNIEQFGGYINRSDNNAKAGLGSTDLSGYSIEVPKGGLAIIPSTGRLAIGVNIATGTYDVWVLYTKR